MILTRLKIAFVLVSLFEDCVQQAGYRVPGTSGGYGGGSAPTSAPVVPGTNYGNRPAPTVPSPGTATGTGYQRKTGYGGTPTSTPSGYGTNTGNNCAPSSGGYQGRTTCGTGSGGYGTGTGSNSGVLTSDGCFRITTNMMLVNAQPFERRSLIDSNQCQRNCLAQQNTSSLYQCRSFVYDSNTQVCDLFAHTASAFPAKLVPAPGKHYYQFTGTCSGTGGPGTGTGSSSCSSGEVVRYMRIERVELRGSDTAIINSVDLQTCQTACSQNMANSQSITCRSFDYDQGTRTCRLSDAAGEPSGNGELVASSGADYYEKFCVSEADARNCPDVFERIPQMIMLGFAENVVSTRTLEECLMACLQATQRFGEACRSAQYYFDSDFQEPSMNCIINTVSRETNPDLFIPENVDSVDYFEINCNSRLRSPRRRLPVAPGVRNIRPRQNLNSNQFFGRLNVPGFSAVQQPQFRELRPQRGSVRPSTTARFNPDTEPVVDVRRPEFAHLATAFGVTRRSVRHDEGLSLSGYEWTSWTKCRNDNMQLRFKRCPLLDITKCPREEQRCDYHVQVLADSVATDDVCAPDRCCPFEGTCGIGTLTNQTGHKHWCFDPCRTPKMRIK